MHPSTEQELDAVAGDHRGCVACGGTESFDFFTVENIPVDVGSLMDSPETACDAVCGDMILQVCPECGLVHNRKYDESLIRFAPGYDASLVHSPQFHQAILDLADSLIRRFSLHGKTVLEIGCGQAHLLKAICQQTEVQAVGIDPSCEGSSCSIGESTLRLVSDRFEHSGIETACDLILCISVLEDIPRPLRFLKRLRKMIGDTDAQLYFELFNGLGAIESGSTWSPHYEQCNYFGLDSVRALFSRAGFRVQESGEVAHNNQYLFIQAKPQNPPGASTCEMPRTGFDGKPVIDRFVSKAQRDVARWSDQFSAWKRDRRRVFLWGSGGKAISLLSMVPESEMLRGVVDINPSRQGKFLPKSGKPVISPHSLTRERPEVIVISNPAYRLEIEAELQRLDVTCELVVA